MGQIQVRDPHGRKVWVPEHYMDHPTLSKPFTRLPSDPKRSGDQAPQDPDDQLPDESWSHAQLDKFAEPLGITFPAGATKADKVAAMTQKKD